MEESRTTVDGDLRRAWASLRAPQWWHFLPIPLASVAPAWHADPRAGLVRGLTAMLVVGLCLGYAYGLNAITDRRGDRDDRKNPLRGLSTVPLAVPLVVSGAAVLALSIGATLGLDSAGCVLTSLLAGTLYSAGPRLKALPLVNTTTNAIIFLPLLGVGHVPGAERVMPMLMLTFGALLTQNQLLHEVADHDEDLESGVRTSAVALGRIRALRLAIAVSLVAAVALVVIGTPTWPARLAALFVLLPVPWIARIHAGSASRGRTFHRVYALAAGACVFVSLLAHGALG